MEQSTEIFVGIDVSKARNAIAVATEGRNGEVRYVGEVDSSVDSMRRLIKRCREPFWPDNALLRKSMP